MKLLSLLAIDLKRSFFSLRFLFGIIGIIICYFVNIYQDLILGGTGVIYFYSVAQFGSLSVLYILFSAIPASTFYCDDFNSKFIRLNLQRISKLNYAISKYITAFISSFAVVVLAELLFMFLLSIRYEWISNEYELSNNYGVFSTLINKNFAIFYVFLRALIRGLSASFFIGTALSVSTLRQNRFLVLSIPLILNYFIDNLSRIFKFPVFLQQRYISSLSVEIGNSWRLTFGYSCFIYICLNLIMLLVFCLLCKRSVENE